jgi:hypothetical protein
MRGDFHVTFPHMPAEIDSLFKEEEDPAHVPPIGKGFSAQLQKTLNITQASHIWR